MTGTFVRGMRGLGDCIYQRAFVRALPGDVWIRTPWPELVVDLPRVRVVEDRTSLRTQGRNIARQAPERWSPPPAGAREIRVSYHAAQQRGRSIPDAMRHAFGVEPAGWNLPAFPAFPARGRPLAVVRPVTDRREWASAARNPLPEYVAEVAADLMATHHVVSVADLADGQEWLVGEPPPAHERFHAGELDVAALLGLVQSTDVVVGGVGWIVPACVAAGVPLFCILGGHGQYNAPEKLIDNRMATSGRVRFATPDRFCRCADMRHRCDKRIPDLAESWSAFRRECMADGPGVRGPDVD